MNSYATCESDTKNSLVEKLKSKEKELSEMRRRFCECKEECNRLNIIKEKFADVKSSAACTEEMLTFERQTLCNELKIKCKQLSDIEARYNEEKRYANDQKCKCNNLFTTLMEVNKAIGQNYYELKNQVHKLQKEICEKKDDLCNLEKKVKELQRDNEFYVMEINVQKKKVYERECQLKQMALISDKIIKIKQKCDDNCNPENKMENPIQNVARSEPKHYAKAIPCSHPRNITPPKIYKKNRCN